MPYKDKEKQRQYSSEYQKKKRAEDVDAWRAYARDWWRAAHANEEWRRQQNERRRKHYTGNKKQMSLYRKDYRLKPEVRQRRWYLKRYGITLEQFMDMLRAQGERCAICRNPFEQKRQSRNVDHCHETGVVRGILCFTCNSGLGNFRDNPAVLQRAAWYLLAHKKVADVA